jgi:hypothetical protein
MLYYNYVFRTFAKKISSSPCINQKSKRVE